jgi:hypothetical protein
MVITFEEKKQSPVKNLLIAAAVVAVVGVVGFFGYQYFQNLNQVAPPVSQNEVNVNWTALKDPKLDELHLFQDVKPIEGDIGKENPFE